MIDMRPFGYSLFLRKRKKILYLTSFFAFFNALFILFSHFLCGHLTKMLPDFRGKTQNMVLNDFI